jgi:hypothetical protein
VTVADTWDEAAWRARLTADDTKFPSPPFSAMPLRKDLRAALAEIDRLRAKLDEADGVIAAATSAITEQLHRAVALRRECDRLRAALRPFAAVAARPEVRDWSGGCGLVVYGLGSPNLDDCRRAAAALGGRP